MQKRENEMQTVCNVKFNEEQEKICATHKAAEKLIKKAFDDNIECATQLSDMLYDHCFLAGYIDEAWDKNKKNDWPTAENLARDTLKLMTKDITGQLKESIKTLEKNSK
jgi:hypothetical protein